MLQLRMRPVLWIPCVDIMSHVEWTDWASLSVRQPSCGGVVPTDRFVNGRVGKTQVSHLR